MPRPASREAERPAVVDCLSDDDSPLPRRNSFRASMQAVVAANRAKKAAEDKVAQEKAAAELAAAEEAAKSSVVLSSDERYAESRSNSEARKMLVRREQEKKRIGEYHLQMEKVRAVQQAAVKSPHGNAEKLQARLRATRRSKELMNADSEPSSAAA